MSGILSLYKQIEARGSRFFWFFNRGELDAKTMRGDDSDGAASANGSGKHETAMYLAMSDTRYPQSLQNRRRNRMEGVAQDPQPWDQAESASKMGGGS